MKKGCSPFYIHKRGVIVMTLSEAILLFQLIAMIVFGILNLKK